MKLLRYLTQRIVAHPYLQRSESLGGYRGIILWWESRRVPYNLAVGITGLLTSFICWGCAVLVELSGKFEEGLFPDPPLFVIFFVVLYAVGANVCYTAGWIVECLLHAVGRKDDPFFGPLSFALGTTFSLLLTLAPAILLIGAALAIHANP